MRPAYEQAKPDSSGTSRACGRRAPRARSRVPQTRHGSPARWYTQCRSSRLAIAASPLVAQTVASSSSGRSRRRSRSSCTQSRQRRAHSSARHFPSGRVRVQARPEQQLGAVDVADPAHDRLVHEQQRDRRRLARDDGDEALLALVRIVHERIGAELRDRRGDLVGALQLAGRRPAQVGARRSRSGAAGAPARRSAGATRRPLGQPASSAQTSARARAPARRTDRGERVLARRVQHRVVRDDRPALVGLPHPSVRRRDRRIDEDLAGEVPRAVDARGARAARGRPRTRGTSACRPRARSTRPRDRRAATAPSSKRPCGLDAATVRRRSCASNCRAMRWTEWPSGIRTTPSSRRSRPAMAPVVSYSAASCAMRRTCRSSPENGVAMKVSMNSVTSLERVLACADRDHVGVVVLARELRGRDAPDECGADARHLVRRDLLAVARTAEHDRRVPRRPHPDRRTTACAARMQKAG